jgi:hypothetical protein
LNNCVGVGNHTVFYCYLVSIWIYLVAIDLDFLLNLYLYTTSYTTERVKNDIIHISSFKNFENFSEQLSYDITIIIVLILGNFFLFFVTLILGVQS